MTDRKILPERFWIAVFVLVAFALGFAAGAYRPEPRNRWRLDHTQDPTGRDWLMRIDTQTGRVDAFYDGDWRETMVSGRIKQ